MGSIATTPLITYVTEHYLPAANPAYGNQCLIRRLASELTRHRGGSLTIGQLTAQLVNSWLTSLDGELAVRTIRNQRIMLHAVWNFAYLNQHVETRPVGLMKLRVPELLPRAWTLAEVKQIYDATQDASLDTHLGRHGIHLGRYLNAMARFVYDTAVRSGDTERVAFDAINEDGQLYLLQSKTQREIIRHIKPKTADAIRAIREPQRRLIFPVSRKAINVRWHQLLKIAGLPTGHREGLQKMRRTAATHAESAVPGEAAQLLGHRTPGMAAKHYIDERHIAKKKIMPPDID